MISGVGRIEGNVYSYSPDYSDAGTYEVTIKVTDGKGGEAQDSFTITVNDVNRAPSIDVPDQSVSETQTLTINLLNYAMDPDGDSLTFEKVSGVGSIDGNIFSYTPGYDDAGTHVVTIKAIDSRGGEAQDSFTITVNDVNRAPSIEIGDQVVNEGEVLELNLEEYATDPDGDALSFTMISGVGRIEGNVYSYSPDYSDAGTYEVTIKVADGKGGEAQDSFTITVNDVNRAPSIDVPDQSVSETQTLTINLLNYAMDPDGDSLTFEKVSGVGSIDGNIFSYTPGYDDAGTHVVTIKAIDGRGGEAQDSFNINVSDKNRPPQFTSFSPENGASNVSTNTTLEWSAIDLDGDTITYDLYFGLTETPPIVLSSTSAKNYVPEVLIHGTTYYWKVIASDGKSTVSSETMSFSVEEESFNESSLGIRDSVLEANSLEDVIIHAKGLENVAGIQIVIEYEPEYIDTSDVSVTLMGPIEGFLKVVKQLEGNRLLISVADISGSEIDILDEDIMKITLKTLTAGKTEIRFVGEETEVKDSSLNSLAVDTKDKGIFWIK
ncbi:Ig-like domain-containing protein [Kosmotoga pacifica]|uniref:Ig-like domain-containing protein n=1 Tax=Kosmotoga pacifica TaxID=1330330 RepID=UPI00069C054C|nr:Ig-like domain-containing protein [Kosmotoga pacifica]